MRDAAKYLSCAYWAIRQLVYTSELTPIRIGKRFCLDRRARFMDRTAKKQVFFSKLSEWSKSKTKLKVSVLLKGQKAKIYRGVIFSVDEENFQIGFIEPPRVITVFD